MNGAARSIWKLGKYLFGTAVGVLISMSFAQQKFPPNLAMLTKVQELQRIPTAIPTAENSEPRDPFQTEDPFAEAAKLHEKQREHWQAADKIINGAEEASNQLTGEKQKKALHNYKVYKTQLAKEAKPEENPEVKY
jgi:hypothetical protein